MTDENATTPPPDGSEGSAEVPSPDVDEAHAPLDARAPDAEGAAGAPESEPGPAAEATVLEAGFVGAPIEGPDKEGASESPDELPPHLEAAYQKLSRRMIVAVTVVALLVFASAAVIGTRAISKRFEGARKLDAARRLVERADKTVLEIDEVVRGQVGAELADKAQAVTDEVSATEEELRTAIDLIESAYDSVTDDEQETARLLRAAAAARLEMLEPADRILAANVKAGRALAPATRGWELVLEAEELADEAVRSYNRLNKEGVTTASTLSGQAEAKLVDARTYLSQAATAFPEAGFDRHVAFVDGKIGLLRLSQQSNTAWLAGKIPEANALIKQYNAEEQKVIEIAKSLPATPAKAISMAYDRLVAEDTKAYFEAREAATKADAALDTF